MGTPTFRNRRVATGKDSGIFIEGGRGIFIININHPIIREEYDKRRRELKIPVYCPFSDLERAVFDLDMLRKYMPETIPDWVMWRLRTPLYMQAWEEQKKRIKK